MKRKNAKGLTYMRPVSLLRLMFWQLQTIIVALLLNMGIQMYMNNIHLEHLEKIDHQLRTGYAVCSEIGWTNCKKVHTILKERNDSYDH